MLPASVQGVTGKSWHSDQEAQVDPRYVPTMPKHADSMLLNLTNRTWPSFQCRKDAEVRELRCAAMLCALP